MILQSIISQSKQNATRTFQSLYVDTSGNGSESKAFDPFYTYSVGKNPVDDNYYLAMLMDGGSPNNRATQVFKYSDDLTLLDSYIIPNDASITSAYDSHLKPVIAFDDSGHLLVSREKGANSTTTSNGHNTDQLLYKTTVVGDLSTLTLINTNTGYWSYQILWNNDNGVFIGSRGDASVEELDAFNISISTDGGLNFTDYEVYDTGLNGGGRAYTSAVHNYDNDDLIVVHNQRSSVTSTFVALYVLKSSDGINWGNFQDTFTKNVDTSTSITQAELDANCLVWEGATADDAINFEGGNYKDGKIRLLISRSLRDDVIESGNAYQTYQELRLYTYDGGWTYTDVSDIIYPYYGLWAIEKIVSLAWDGVYDYIYVVDRDSTPHKVYEHKSINLFQTYTTTLVQETAGNFYFGSHTYNAETNSDRLLVLLDVQGDWSELDDSANLVLIKPD